MFRGAALLVVADELAFNGRSEGSLTVDDDRLLFDTSGSLSSRGELHSAPQKASGVLWSVDATGEISAIANGFKHAYAQARTPDGRLWTTEMSDGRFDAGATPTSIVAAPWNEETLLVSLWNRGQVVAISTREASSPNRSTVVFDGAERPQHLTVDGSRVLLVDFAGGQVLSLEPAS